MLSITNQLVVATEHLRLVEGALAAAGLRAASTERNERLGLTLVVLDVDVARLVAAAAVLQEDVPDDERTQLHVPYEEGLDHLLVSLRDRFRHRYSGWTGCTSSRSFSRSIDLTEMFRADAGR